MSGRPMRVLHVIPAVAPRYGGPSEAVVHLCRALAARGIDVTLASTDADGTGRLAVPLQRRIDYAGVPAIFFSRRRSESFKHSPDLARWLSSSVAGYDLLHIHAVFSHASIAAARRCWADDVPYVLRPLGTLTPWALAQKPWRKFALRHLVGQRMVKRAAAVHYTTQAEARLTESVLGSTAGVVVPLGVDEEWLVEDVTPGERREAVVLAIGRLHPVKNLESAIAAFHSVKASAEFSEWRFVIAGDGDPEYRRALERASADGPARGQISFVGWVDDAAKRLWLQRAAVMVQPSHQESFGVSVLEALASGVPVIASSGVSLAPDIAEHGAGWVYEDAQGGLPAALRSAMADAETRQVRARSARRMASRFTWAAAAEALEAVYERLRAGGRATSKATVESGTAAHPWRLS